MAAADRGSIRLAFSGRSGAGKDTLGRAVLRQAGYAPVRLAFGDLVKEEVRGLIRCVRDNQGLPTEEAIPAVAGAVHIAQDIAAQALRRCAAIDVDSDGLPCGRDARAVYEWWGADVRRARDRRYWLRAMATELTEFGADRSGYVADCRFESELDLCRGYGFTTVRVLLADHPRQARLLRRDGHAPPDAGNEHPIESAITDAVAHDLVVTNDRSPERVAAEILAALPGASRP